MGVLVPTDVSQCYEPSDVLEPSDALEPVACIFARATRTAIARTLGCYEYQVFVYPRGLGGSPVGLLDHRPGWTSLSWEMRLSDLSELTVQLANAAAMSVQCKGIFAQIRNWQYELVIVRGDGSTWSGPILKHGTSNGSAYITAYAIDAWATRRRVRYRHVYTEKDPIELSDAYAELWRDAVNVDNRMEWQLETIPTSISTALQIGANEGPMFPSAVQTLLDQGLTYITLDRTTIAGPPDTTVLPHPVLDEHLIVIPDVDVDGSIQANDIELRGDPRGNTNAKAPFGRSANDDLRARDGLLEASYHSARVHTDSHARRVATRVRGMVEDEPVAVSGLQFRSSAPFPLTSLMPGRLLDVRLQSTAKPVLDRYRISRVTGGLAPQSGEAAEERVAVELEPVGIPGVESA